MPLPLLVGLSKAARAALPVIQGGVREGLSSRAINSIIKDTFGKGIRRSTLLDIIRAENNVERGASALKFLKQNAVPNVKRLPQAVTRIRRNYAFIVRVVGIHADSGLEVTQNVTIATDTALTRNTLEDMAQEVVEQSSERYKMEVISRQLARGVQAGKLGTLRTPIFS